MKIIHIISFYNDLFKKNKGGGEQLFFLYDEKVMLPWNSLME